MSRNESRQPPMRPGGFGRGHGMHGMPKEKAKNPKKTLRRLWGYLYQEKTTLLGVLGLIVIGSGFTLAGPYLIGRAIDDYVVPGDFAGLMRITLLMTFIYLLGAGGTWLQANLMIGIGQRNVYVLRRDLFSKLQTLPLGFFDSRPRGEVMSRLTNDIENISQALSNSLTQVFASLITVVGTLIMMLWLSPILTLITVIVIPLMALTTGRIAKGTRKYFALQQEHLGGLNGLVEETISGQRVVKVFNREAAVMDEFNQWNEKLKDSGIRAQIYSGIIPPLMNVLNNLSFILVAAAGGYLAVQGTITIGVIAAFINYSRQFTRPLNELANQFNVVQSAIAGAERVFAILDEDSEPDDAHEALDLQEVSGAVRFDQVTFGYQADLPVLKGISLDVKAGETIALVGPTGAGKTTIINLLTRFYDINQGQITIDGRDIRELKRQNLRAQLGIVLQDTYLFSESVRENIRYGRLNASDPEVEEAARLANADSFIRRLPQGYGTILSEDGGDLSQGQRQLIAIARAILADPAILILDEATSSVDTRTEVQIQQAMLKLMEGRTSFVIAHRLSTIREADRIVVINHGQIVEEGTHEELLRARGFYHDLYMSQFQRQIS